MSPSCRPLLAAALVGLLSGLPAFAAEAVPPADPSRPVTTVRVGGSAADATYRAARDQAIVAYRTAMAECKRQPAGDRKTCTATAKSTLKSAQTEARAARDQANKKAPRR